MLTSVAGEYTSRYLVLPVLHGVRFCAFPRVIFDDQHIAYCFAICGNWTS